MSENHEIFFLTQIVLLCDQLMTSAFCQASVPQSQLVWVSGIAIAGPTVCNSLSNHLRDPDT